MEDQSNAGSAPVERKLGLVERLRHEALHTGYKPAKPWDLIVEAADEIERLRAALSNIVGAADMHQVHLEQAIGRARRLLGPNTEAEQPARAKESR